MFKNLSKLKNKNKKAFTIAEMTVVLLILSIVMAAILPVTTNKKTGGAGGSGTGGGGSLWKLARNNTDVWFASPSSTQSVLIGTSITPDSSGSGRLYLNIPQTTTRSQIAMMYNNTTVGYIKFKNNNNMGFGPTNPLPTALSGSNNTAIGENALISLTSGVSNISIGSNALRSATTGTYNTAINTNALRSMTSASHNTAIGHDALYTDETGEDNVGIGQSALRTNKTGHYNVGVGRYAGYSLTSSDNTAIGHQSLFSNTSGVGNTAVGAYAGLKNTTGNYSVFIGYESARYNAKTGAQNVGIGYQSMLYANGNGSYNIGIGSSTLRSYTTGQYNVNIGAQSGYSTTTGSNNIGIGLNTLYSTTTGGSNTVIGTGACTGITTGSNKTCLGASSGAAAPSGFSTTNSTTETIIGSGTGQIFLHAGSIYAGAGNDATVASSFKVTGDILANSFLKTGTYANIGTDLSVGNDTNIVRHLVVGQESRTNHLYANRIISRSFKEGGTANTYAMIVYGTLYGPWTPSSDKRLKNIEGFANTGLEEVKKLNVYKYTYKGDPESPKIGLIAQDVEKVIPFAVVKGEDGYLSLSQENIIYTMFNAIKDLDKLYESLKTKFQDYIVRLNLAEDRINALMEVNRDLSKRIDELEKRVNKLEKEYTKLEKKQCKCKE